MNLIDQIDLNKDLKSIEQIINLITEKNKTLRGDIGVES